MDGYLIGLYAWILNRIIWMYTGYDYMDRYWIGLDGLMLDRIIWMETG